MPINRSSWYRVTSKNSLPSLPCPYCSTGKLKQLGQPDVVEPKFSADYRTNNPEDWEVDNLVERWSARLRCDEPNCGEIVHMVGDTDTVETDVQDEDGQMYWGAREDVLRIRAVFPAPPLFRISDSVPRRVKRQLELAFRLYWIDTSACIARLRTAVEALLDEQKVPKERMLTKGPNAGKMHRMNLEQRIDSFTAGALHNAQLQGLRNIGNLGTHGTDDVEEEDLFNAIDVLEFALTGIYDTKTINAKAAQLRSKKAAD